MKESMVRSQFLSLEEPTPDEDDCFIVDVGGSMGESQEAALRAVEGVLEQVVVRETEGMQGSGRGRVV